MIVLLCFVLAVLAVPFKSKTRLEAENAVLRHQLIVLRRKMPGRVRLMDSDRWFLIQLYRWFPSILNVLTIVHPETLVRWHRAGFRCYWRWKSRARGGRPQIETDLRKLIRQMSIENPLWGAPRIHGELLKLGFEVAQSSVAYRAGINRASWPSFWSPRLRWCAPTQASMPIRHGGIFENRASTSPRDHFCRSTMAPSSSRPTTWNEFLPISMPTKAIEFLRASAMACSLSLVPRTSIACWWGAGARPDHPISG